MPSSANTRTPTTENDDDDEGRPRSLRTTDAPTTSPPYRGGLEEGSLLREALEHARRRRSERRRRRGGGGDDDDADDPWCDDDDDATVFTLFSLSDSGDSVARVRRLAETGRAVNAALLAHRRRRPYPWFVGGEGPRFEARRGPKEEEKEGEGRPRLRAVCRRGPSAHDEWCAVAACARATAGADDAAVRAVDAVDGRHPVLLIEAADVLPAWCDRTDCRNRCWIVGGRVRLLPPDDDDDDDERSPSIDEALRRLRIARRAPPTTDEEAVWRAIVDRRVGRFLDPTTTTTTRGDPWRGVLHRTAVALPLTTAELLRRRPELLGAAVTAFCGHATRRDGEKETKETKTEPLVPFRRLVLSTVTLSRPQYAALITGAGAARDDVPLPRSVELNRVARSCRAAPHLRNAVDVGTRLSAGLERWYRRAEARERRRRRRTGSDDLVATRTREWRTLLSSDAAAVAAVDRAWAAGPRDGAAAGRALVEALAGCPARRDDDDDDRPSLWSLSEDDRRSDTEVVRETVRVASEMADTSFFPAPTADDVDDDGWMDLDDETKESTETTTKVSTETSKPDKEPPSSPSLPRGLYGTNLDPVDSLLEGFKTFLKNSSGVDGVSTTNRNGNDVSLGDYFSSDETSSESDGAEDTDTDTDDDEDDDVRRPLSIKDYMRAMDEELRGTRAADDDGVDDNDNDGDERLRTETTVLSNLLRSMEAESLLDAGTGPTTNVLREMGVDPPRPRPSTRDDEE